MPLFTGFIIVGALGELVKGPTAPQVHDRLGFGTGWDRAVAVLREQMPHALWRDALWRDALWRDATELGARRRRLVSQLA